MIRAEFYLKNECFTGFSVSGHAGYGISGQDVACAAVSSAAELTANAITEILKVPAAVDVFENEVKLVLPDLLTEEIPGGALAFLKAMRLQLELISEEYPGSLRILDVEV